MREAFVGALMETNEAGFSARRADCLHSWICNLGFDRTRLPDDFAPETMRKLLRIYPEDTPRKCIGEVCDRCGLYRPYRFNGYQDQVMLANYFECCPHCGCPEWTWSSLVGVWSKRETGVEEGTDPSNARPSSGETAETEATSCLFFGGES